jgi:hypothetical protein
MKAQIIKTLITPFYRFQIRNVIKILLMVLDIWHID